MKGLFEIGLFARMYDNNNKGDSPSFAVVLDVNTIDDTMIYMVDNLGNNLQKVTSDFIYDSFSIFGFNSYNSSSGLLKKLDELSDRGFQFSSQDMPALTNGYHIDLSTGIPSIYFN